MADIHQEHPFLVWYAYLLKRRFAEMRRNDIILNDYGAKRFGLGVETAKDSGCPVLGVGIHDARAIKSITWSSAGIICGQQYKDWIALAARDIRPEDSIEPNPVPLRLWIPFPLGALDVWVETQPKKLNIKRIKNGKRSLPVFEKAPFLGLGLSVKNKWEMAS